MLFRPDRRTCIAQTMPQPILGHHLLPDHAEQTKFRERVKKLPGSPRESAIVSLGSILDAVLVLAPNLDPDRLVYCHDGTLSFSSLESDISTWSCSS